MSITAPSIEIAECHGASSGLVAHHVLTYAGVET